MIATFGDVALHGTPEEIARALQLLGSNHCPECACPEDTPAPTEEAHVLGCKRVAGEGECNCLELALNAPAQPA